MYPRAAKRIEECHDEVKGAFLANSFSQDRQERDRAADKSYQRTGSEVVDEGELPECLRKELEQFVREWWNFFDSAPYGDGFVKYTSLMGRLWQAGTRWNCLDELGCGFASHVAAKDLGLTMDDLLIWFNASESMTNDWLALRGLLGYRLAWRYMAGKIRLSNRGFEQWSPFWQNVAAKYCKCSTLTILNRHKSFAQAKWVARIHDELVDSLTYGLQLHARRVWCAN
jgi:hypothetical protein